MAIVDSQTILSYRQVVTDVTYSQHGFDWGEKADYGVGEPIWLEVTIHGAFAKNLRCQLIGSDSKDFTNPVVLGDSGLYKKEELTAGKLISVQLVQTDKKYRYMCARYIPSAVGSAEDANATPSGDNACDCTPLAPPPKVGEVPAELANGLSAHLALVAPTQVQYKYVNEDKDTAGL